MATARALILASASPFRRALLSAAGLTFQVRTAPVDEYAITAATPPALATARAEAKALAVATLEPEALVIGADQVLSLGDVTFDKAPDAATARARLRQLSGQTHHLHAAVILAYQPAAGTAAVLRRTLVSVPMSMRTLTAEEIDAYVATDEWRGCVGCYQYENRGVHLLHEVKGDHSAIIGLPLLPLLAELRSLGVSPLTAPRGPWTLTGAQQS